MSYPWDDENIQPNLRTLARLQRGDQLSVLKDGENVNDQTYHRGNRGLRSRFKIEGKLRQQFVRSKKGESILNDEQYLSPLCRFFRAASGAWSRRLVTGAEVLGAKQGLEKLLETHRNDRDELAKVRQIIQAVDRELRGVRVDGILLESGLARLTLGSQAFPGMRQRIMQTILKPTDTVCAEYQMTPDRIAAIYGPNAQPQPRTLIPIGGAYKRQWSGVCRQYVTESLERAGVYLEGARLGASEEDIKKLFAYANKDEALMFAVSQIATQGCLTGVGYLLLTKGGRDGTGEVPLIMIDGQYMSMNIGGGHANLTKNGRLAVITTEKTLPGTTFAMPGDNEFDGKQLSDWGISSIQWKFSATLGRMGDVINLELTESMLKIVTT